MMGMGDMGATGDPNTPNMVPYFNNNLPIYLLFEAWTPGVKHSYAGAWFAIFFLAMVQEALQSAYSHVDTAWWARYCAPSNDIEAGCSGQKKKGIVESSTLHLIAMDIARGLSRLLLGGLAYLIMMSVMTFNLGIFFAAISGFGVGSALFGRRARPTRAGTNLP